MTYINPNDLPHDPDTGKPIHPKSDVEKLPVGTKHLADGSKVLPDGKVLASPSFVEGPPNPNDLAKDKDGKLTEESQAIIANWQAKNNPEPKPDVKAKPKGDSEPKAEPNGDSEPKAEPKGDSEPKAEPNGDSEPKAEPNGDSEPKAEPKGDSEPVA